jgi:hypothetical protein
MSMTLSPGRAKLNEPVNAAKISANRRALFASIDRQSSRSRPSLGLFQSTVHTRLFNSTSQLEGSGPLNATCIMTAPSFTPFPAKKWQGGLQRRHTMAPTLPLVFAMAVPLTTGANARVPAETSSQDQSARVFEAFHNPPAHRGRLCPNRVHFRTHAVQQAMRTDHRFDHLVGNGCRCAEK